MLAERVRFELTLEFPLNTLSKRAPSATRPPLQIGCYQIESITVGAAKPAWRAAKRGLRAAK
jgi:hypothetical protein